MSVTQAPTQGDTRPPVFVEGRDQGFSSPEALSTAVAEETAALTALGEALVGSDRPLVTVSGTPWVPGRLSTEADPLPTDGPVGGRVRTVTAILELASRGVRSSAVRLPRTVHNNGDAVRDIAEVIGRRLGLPVEPVATQTYGPVGPIFAIDQPSSSAVTRQGLGWEPKRPRLLEDLERLQP